MLATGFAKQHGCDHAYVVTMHRYAAPIGMQRSGAVVLPGIMPPSSHLLVPSRFMVPLAYLSIPFLVMVYCMSPLMLLPTPGQGWG